MTRIGYAKPQTFIALEAFDTTTRLEVNQVFLFSCELLPTARYYTHLHWLDKRQRLLRFLSS